MTTVANGGIEKLRKLLEKHEGQYMLGDHGEFYILDHRPLIIRFGDYWRH